MKRRINVSIEENILNEIDNEAKAWGIDRSTMITIMADKFCLDQEAKRKEILYKHLEDC